MARSQWYVIARREFLERVRTKWFVIVTLLGPLAMIGIIVVPAYLSMKSAEKSISIQVVDKSERGVGEQLVTMAAAAGKRYKLELIDIKTDDDTLLERVASGEIDGYLVLPAGIVESGHATYRGDNASSLSLGMALSGLVSAAVITLRLEDEGISPEKLTALLAEVHVKTVGRKGTSGAASFVAGYIVMFLLYMAILLYAMNVMRGVILEKTSRVVEIIVSAVKPRSLMLGKIIGVGSVGLAQLTLWAILALILINFREPILGLFGISGAGSIALPSLGIGDFLVVLIYFLLGFFLYSSVYAAIGAMVSSEQEATQLQMPVILLLVVPVMCVQIVANDPRGGISSALTQFPFSSPVLMPMRYLLDGASAAEVALSMAILVVTIIGCVFAAAKIYRLGILLTGKRPSLKTVWRWLRH